MSGYIYTKEYYKAVKKRNLTFCLSVDEPGEHYAKWNKPVRERQVPYGFTYSWNLMNKINKQNKNRLITDTENRLRAVRGERDQERWVEKMKGLREKKLQKYLTWIKVECKTYPYMKLSLQNIIYLIFKGALKKMKIPPGNLWFAMLYKMKCIA